MDMTDQDKLCLYIISKHSGNIGWYLLDKELVFQGIVPRRLLESVCRLRDHELIDVDGDPNAGDTRYHMTPKGAQLLRDWDMVP